MQPGFDRIRAMADVGSSHAAPPVAPHGQKRRHGAEMHGRKPPQPGAKAAGWKRGGHHVGPNDSGRRSRRKTAHGEVLVPRPDATGDAGGAVLTGTGKAAGARAKSKANPPKVGAHAKSKANPPLVGARAKSMSKPLVGARAKSKVNPKYEKRDRHRRQKGVADDE